MSLVGTRPPTVDEWDKYELHHRARLATKPGLTGMWQVSGRSNITDLSVKILRTHDSSQKAGETIEKSTGLYFVTFMHNVEISDCFPSGKRSLPFLFFFVFWKPGLFCTKKQMMFF